HSLARASERFERAARAIELVSPQAVLERGYAIVRDADGRIVRDSAQAPAGSGLAVTLARGELRVQVQEQAPGSMPAAPSS
ncbi:MAG: hypothetical protein J0H09_28845, partial [Burkholderiales bacterium]|nr:hypothetical protein [Burkholderiales bacterium]